MKQITESFNNFSTVGKYGEMQNSNSENRYLNQAAQPVNEGQNAQNDSG